MNLENEDVYLPLLEVSLQLVLVLGVSEVLHSPLGKGLLELLFQESDFFHEVAEDHCWPGSLPEVVHGQSELVTSQSDQLPTIQLQKATSQLVKSNELSDGQVTGSHIEEGLGLNQE